MGINNIILPADAITLDGLPCQIVKINGNDCSYTFHGGDGAAPLSYMTILPKKSGKE